MPKLQSHIQTLLELYMKGAATRPLVVSTSALGKALGLSQQAVSKHLAKLEAEGLVVRKRSGKGVATLVTARGREEVISLYSGLKAAVEGSREITFHGRVTTGLGEGAYYISLPGYMRQFKELLGFEPYPGTLNLVLEGPEIDMKAQLKSRPGLYVAGFRDSNRTYGPVTCFKATVEGKYEAAVLLIERTHHDESTLEVVSPHNLRNELSLSDGSVVSVTVRAGDYGA